MSKILISAQPQALEVDKDKTAIIMIDMQRDFLEVGGFGDSLGNDVSLLTAAIAPCKALLTAARKAGMLIIHTREGHRADMSDAPKAKVERGAPSMR
ncbi:MAG: cysteine hydrolase family protein, partial [Methylophilus sp.]